METCISLVSSKLAPLMTALQHGDHSPLSLEQQETLSAKLAEAAGAIRLLERTINELAENEGEASYDLYAGELLDFNKVYSDLAARYARRIADSQAHVNNASLSNSPSARLDCADYDDDATPALTSTKRPALPTTTTHERSAPNPASGDVAGRVSLFGDRSVPAADESANGQLASLIRTRTMMSAEIERMASVSVLLDQDHAVLHATIGEHAAIAADTSEARERVRHIKSQETRDRRLILLAFTALAASAAYIVARRILYTFTGIVLP